MDEPSPALHKAIVGVDIEGFADRRRTNLDQMVMRDGLYRCLRAAFARSDIDWKICYHEDRGDGALILVPPQVPKALLVTRFPQELSVALRSYNRGHGSSSRIRVRLVVHAGEIHEDRYGVAGTAINVAFRLLEAHALKQALAGSPGLVALIASAWFFDEVIRHTQASSPSAYRQVRVVVKETNDVAWVCLPDGHHGLGEGQIPSGVAASAGPRQVPAGLSGNSGRRFLLTGVVSHYHADPSWDREDLAQDLHRMIELFTRELGYEHVPVMGLDPTRQEIQDGLRSFCTSPERQPDDYVTVYLAGRGEVLPVDGTGFEQALLPADAKPGGPHLQVIKSGDVTEWILAGTPVCRLLVIIDVCFSQVGGLDFARNALACTEISTRLNQQDGSGVVVITATQPAPLAVPGAFTTAFTHAVRHQATAGHMPGALSIDAVINVLRANPDLPASLRVQSSLLAGRAAPPDFLLNPRRDTVLAGLDLAEQQRRWRIRVEQEHHRVEEMRDQFVPRIAGFAGRHHALADIVQWLDTPADPRPVIVTGDPGSGKTAVLGLLAALADPRRRPTVPRDGLPTAIPREGSIGTAIYAGNLTTGQVLAGLAMAADIDDIDPDPAALSVGLARLLSGLRQSGRTQTAMIDALDEAADPAHLAEELLRPLIELGAGAIRLLLGTRWHVCDYLGRGWRDKCKIIDLDGHDYADPAALAEVTRRVLTHGTPPAGAQAGKTAFASCPETVLDVVVAAIAAAAGNSFFVARILAATQASLGTVPDPADPAWRASLPRTAGPAMRRDLEIRLGDQAAKAVDLLRPLAYAQGRGLPWEDVWALLANALTPGLSYTNEDLLWLAGHAGSFIVEGGTLSDRSVYRLYHRSLGEDLIADRVQAADEHAITAALVEHVPRRRDGQRDWPASHPYTRTHLATHAASCGDIDHLAQDPGFLLAASPPQLLAALDATISAPAHAASDAYRSALPLIRRHLPPEMAAYLGLAAHLGQADSLADSSHAGFASPWRARWASWRPQRPHQQLTGHSGWVRSAAAADLYGRPVIITGSSDCTVRVWDLATGTATGEPLTGHTGSVNAVAAAELDGRPVIISGSSDQTVRVWDLATGTATGHAFTVGDRHPLYTRAVNTVLVAELDGRPVIISGSSDCTVRVWDLATGTATGEPLTGHGGPVNAMAAAELDGRPVIISGSDDQTVRVWDLATGTAIGEPLTGHSGPVNAMAAAELDGRPVIISGSIDQTVRAWELATGGAAGEPLAGHTGYVLTVAAAELDGRPVVISGSSDHTVGVWDLVASTAGDPFTGHSDWVRAVAAAELNGRPMVISGGDDQTIRVRDLATGAAISRPLTGHTGGVLAVAATELDGRPVIISGSSDRTVRVWDLATGAAIGEPLTGHSGHILAVTTAELDGRPVIISGSSDCTVRVWDLATGAAIGEPLAGHAEPVNAVAAAELNSRPVVISGSDDLTVRVWDLATGTAIGEPLTGHDDWIRSVATVKLDGRPVVISGSDDLTVRVWDLATGTAIGEPFDGHAGPVNAVATAKLDGRPVVISGSDDLTVRVWDLATGTAIGEPFTSHTGCVLGLATAELDDCAVVISGSDDMTVQVWDLASRAAIGEPFHGHAGPVNAVAAARLDGRSVVISGSSDQTVRVWDLATGAAIGEPLTGHAEPVNAVAAAELDGRPVVISGSDDMTVRVWDLATGAAIGEPFSGHTGRVLAVAIAELDGHAVVISGSDDWTVQVCDLVAGAAIGSPLTGHGDWVRSVAVTELHGRQVVISGSSDQTIRVWDLANGTALGEPLTGHTGHVLAVAAAELDGRPVIISCSDDQTVRVWDLETVTEIEGLRDSPAGAVRSLALSTKYRKGQRAPVQAAIGVGDVVAVSSITSLGDDTRGWSRVGTPEVTSQVLALAWAGSGVLVLGAELGIVVLDFAVSLGASTLTASPHPAADVPAVNVDVDSSVSSSRHRSPACHANLDLHLPGHGQLLAARLAGDARLSFGGALCRWAAGGGTSGVVGSGSDSIVGVPDDSRAIRAGQPDGQASSAGLPGVQGGDVVRRLLPTEGPPGPGGARAGSAPCPLPALPGRARDLAGLRGCPAAGHRGGDRRSGGRRRGRSRGRAWNCAAGVRARSHGPLLAGPVHRHQHAAGDRLQRAGGRAGLAASGPAAREASAHRDGRHRRRMAYDADPLPRLAAARAVAIRERHVRRRADGHPHERATGPATWALRRIPAALTAAPGRIRAEPLVTSIWPHGQVPAPGEPAFGFSDAERCRFINKDCCRTMCRQRGRQDQL
jgi:WD40 repeat protein